MTLDEPSLQSLYRYAYALTANEGDARDLLHSTIEHCLGKADGQSFSIAYVRRAIRNRFIDGYRHRQSHPHDAYDETDPVIDLRLDTSSLEDIAIAAHDLGRIWQKLEAIDREILYFWAVEGFSMQEIADMLEMARGTLLSRIHRLRVRIRKESNDVDRGIA